MVVRFNRHSKERTSIPSGHPLTARFMHHARMPDALFTPTKRGYEPSEHARGPWDRGRDATVGHLLRSWPQ